MADEKAITQRGHGDNFLARELRMGVRALRDGLQIISWNIIHEKLEYFCRKRRVAFLSEQLTPFIEHSAV